MNQEKLSKNFIVEEFTRSQTAIRMGREIEVLEGSSAHKSLKRLCGDILQPVRDELGAVIITSGVRPDWLNEAIGGSKTSQHPKGKAADFKVVGKTPLEVCQWIEKSELPYDQLIHEFGRWVHVSIAKEGCTPRRQTLTAFRNPTTGKTEYAVGLIPMDELMRTS